MPKDEMFEDTFFELCIIYSFYSRLGSKIDICSISSANCLYPFKDRKIAGMSTVEIQPIKLP